MRSQAPIIGRWRVALAELVVATLTLTACGPPSPAPHAGPDATAIADPAPQDVSPTPAEPGASATVTHCRWFGPAGQYDATYCQRVVDDERLRSKLTSDQRAEAGTTAEAVGAAIDQMGFGCPQPVSQECLAEQARRRMFPPTDNPEQVSDRIRQALGAAGFTNIVVRQTGPADPAPRDAIVYAVPAGRGCVIGHLDVHGRGGGQPQVLGTLPHGQCLA
ncbi:hypothetical protein [Melissospora conviva]|uniref:hypothetical protein n=1 Tax=Melissospora conviva TaxID=3388432 RepID=UPI003B7603E9